MHFREALERSGLTQGELAARSGVDQGLISKLASGVRTNPTLKTARDLEDALRLKPGTLLFGAQDCEVSK